MTSEQPQSDPYEQIALGICQSDRGVDRCPYCIDTCDASWHKHNIYDIKQELRISQKPKDDEGTTERNSKP